MDFVHQYDLITNDSHVAVSAVVPCFNERLVLDELHRRLATVLKQVADTSYEIILVNDGSTDETWDRIYELASTDSHVVGVDLSKNHGHQLALTAGLRQARGDRVVVLDADLQDPPELVPAMLALMGNEHADVVYGKRMHRPGERRLKLISAHLFYLTLSRMSSIHIPSDVGDFRIMTARVVRVLNSMSEHQRFLRGMVPWVGFHQVAFNYNREPRAAGTTKYRWRTMARLAIDALTSFSLKPLRIGIYMGFTAAFIAFLLAIYAVVVALLGQAISGWTSLMLVVLFLGGIQLVVTGVLGEYIGRVHEQTQNRPLVIVRRVVRAGRVEEQP